MAQHDYIIANQSGAAFRADLNNGLAAIVSNNSGAAQPSTTYAYQWWPDTTTGLLKIRNAANNAWITVGTLADTNLGLATLESPTFTGNVTVSAQGDLRLADSDNSNWVALQAPATVATNLTLTAPAADGAADQALVTDGAGALSFASRSRLVRGTAVAATSGTAIDFTSIPSWVRRITVILDSVSTSGATANVILKLGSSGGIENTGYLGYVTTLYNDVSTNVFTSVASGSITGFPVFFGTASSKRYGAYTLHNVSGNTWVATYQFGVTDSVNLQGTSQGGGNKTLSGTLDRVRLTTTNGTDTFDLGTVNIIYEG